jgi:hypothetical protein
MTRSALPRQHAIRCGHHVGTHHRVVEVRACAGLPLPCPVQGCPQDGVHARLDELDLCIDMADEYHDGALDAEMAYERYLEDGGTNGWMETAAFEDWERSRGVVPFDVAYRAALAGFER